MVVKSFLLLHCQGSAHSSASAADMRAIATYPVQAGSKPADSARCRYCINFCVSF